MIWYLCCCHTFWHRIQKGKTKSWWWRLLLLFYYNLRRVKLSSADVIEKFWTLAKKYRDCFAGYSHKRQPVRRISTLENCQFLTWTVVQNNKDHIICFAFCVTLQSIFRKCNSHPRLHATNDAIILGLMIFMLNKLKSALKYQLLYDYRALVVVAWLPIWEWGSLLSQREHIKKGSVIILQWSSIQQMQFSIRVCMCLYQGINHKRGNKKWIIKHIYSKAAIMVGERFLANFAVVIPHNKI